MTLQKTFTVWLVSLVVVIAIIATVLLSSREANRLNLQLAQERQQLGRPRDPEPVGRPVPRLLLGVWE